MDPVQVRLRPQPRSFSWLWEAFARRFAVAQVDDRGLVLQSGKLFPWSDLRGIRKDGEDYVLGFRGGGVRVRPREYEDVTQLWAYLAQVEQTFPRA